MYTIPELDPLIKQSAVLDQVLSDRLASDPEEEQHISKAVTKMAEFTGETKKSLLLAAFGEFQALSPKGKVAQLVERDMNKGVFARMSLEDKQEILDWNQYQLYLLGAGILLKLAFVFHYVDGCKNDFKALAALKDAIDFSNEMINMRLDKASIKNQFFTNSVENNVDPFVEFNDWLDDAGVNLFELMRELLLPCYNKLLDLEKPTLLTEVEQQEQMVQISTILTETEKLGKFANTLFTHSQVRYTERVEIIFSPDFLLAYADTLVMRTDALRAQAFLLAGNSGCEVDVLLKGFEEISGAYRHAAEVFSRVKDNARAAEGKHVAEYNMQICDQYFRIYQQQNRRGTKRPAEEPGRVEPPVARPKQDSKSNVSMPPPEGLPPMKRQKTEPGGFFAPGGSSAPSASSVRSPQMMTRR